MDYLLFYECDRFGLTLALSLLTLNITLTLTECDRFGRNLASAKNVLHSLRQKNVRIVSVFDEINSIDHEDAFLAKVQKGWEEGQKLERARERVNFRPFF
jgi:DNA invertase Pin-like site-specific DNA recombinase